MPLSASTVPLTRLDSVSLRALVPVPPVFRSSPALKMAPRVPLLNVVPISPAKSQVAPARLLITEALPVSKLLPYAGFTTKCPVLITWPPARFTEFQLTPPMVPPLHCTIPLIVPPVQLSGPASVRVPKPVSVPPLTVKETEASAAHSPVTSTVAPLQRTVPVPARAQPSLRLGVPAGKSRRAVPEAARVPL